MEDDIADDEIPVSRAASSETSREASRETTRGAIRWKLLLLRSTTQGET